MESELVQTELRGPVCILTLHRRDKRKAFDPELTDALNHALDQFEDDPAQWVAEIKKFSQDSKVFTMFSRDDYQQILRENNDRLPPGIYVTYPQAYFTNGAFEAIPKSWKAKEREEKFRKIMQADGWPVFSVDGKFTVEYDSANPPNAENHLHTGIGQTQNGFTCIYKPSLSTLSKDKFKMVILDEAHERGLHTDILFTLVK